MPFKTQSGIAQDPDKGLDTGAKLYMTELAPEYPLSTLTQS